VNDTPRFTVRIAHHESALRDRCSRRSEVHPIAKPFLALLREPSRLKTVPRSAIGLVAGSLLGFAISLVLIHVVNRQSFHWSMDLTLPWLPLAGFVGAVLALATVTAVLSGRQAMGGDVVRAVKEDW
jgi:hypothetical protein